MARGTRVQRRLASYQYRSTPYPLPSCGQKDLEKEVDLKKSSKALDRKDWEDATCSVCMEYPHNAVLLLCSSHDKGCRPYMCGTSYRHSNCLDQFKKAYTKAVSPHHGQEQVHDGPLEGSSFGFGSGLPTEKQEVTELACPLCRGQVKGWTVVEAAREDLNAKKRSCMQDDCSFVGTYKELRKHVKAKHPSARPHEVDPILEQKWRTLEHERERNDVISTIRSSMPGALVLGDYVIEGGLHHRHYHRGFDTDARNGEIDDVDNGIGVEDPSWVNVLFLLQAFGPMDNASFRSRLRRLQRGFRVVEEGRNGTGVLPTATVGSSVSATSEGNNISPAGRGRFFGVGRSERRHRRRSRQGH